MSPASSWASQTFAKRPCLPHQAPISPEILRVVASRVQDNDRNDHLLLSPETEDVGPYELPLPRDVSGLETYVPAYLNVSHLRRLAALVS